MKNNVLEKIEEINEENQLSENSKKEILTKIFDNLIIAIDVVAIFTILIVSAMFLNKQNLINVYNMSSAIMIIFTIFVFELAYKKDSGSLAICGIEMLAISIAILFMPYSLIKLDAIWLKLINIYAGIYYIVKVIIMYNRYKSKTLLENSDIKQIVKKESKDTKVEEAIEEIKKTKKEDIIDKTETKKVTKKRTTKKTTTTKKEANKPKTGTKKTTKTKTEPAKTKGNNEKKVAKAGTTSTKAKTATKKKSEGAKTTTKKATTTKKTETKQEVAAPKKRGRPRKETSTK